MEANYDDILGKNAGPCLLNMRTTLPKLNGGKNELGMDDRPTWKILRDLEQCDAVSIRTFEVKLFRNFSHIFSNKKIIVLRKKANTSLRKFNPNRLRKHLHKNTFTVLPVILNSLNLSRLIKD